MNGNRIFTLACSLLLLLQGCAATPPADDGSTQVAAAETEVPELTLNLPQESGECTPGESVDYTFLERGVSALAAGDHIEAVTYFQRYQRLESSPRADWEAGIAIAYDSMLPQSPFYDPQAARSSYMSLREQEPGDEAVNEHVLMMRDALATFVAMQDSIGELRRDNAALAEDLAKREEALKRLRALTLGQQEAAQ